MWISVHCDTGVCFTAPSWNQPPVLELLAQLSKKPMEIEQLSYKNNCVALFVNNLPLSCHELTFPLSEQQEQQHREVQNKREEYCECNEKWNKNVMEKKICQNCELITLQKSNQRIFLLRANGLNKLGDVVIVIGVHELFCTGGIDSCALFSRLILRVLENASEQYKTTQVLLNALCTYNFTDTCEPHNYHKNKLTLCDNDSTPNYTVFSSTANMTKTVNDDQYEYSIQNFFERLLRENSVKKSTKNSGAIINSTSNHDKANHTNSVFTITTNEDKLRRSAFLYFAQNAALPISVLMCSVTLEQHFRKSTSSFLSSLACTTLSSSKISNEPLSSSSKVVNGTGSHAETTSLSLSCTSLLRANEKLCKRSEFWRKLIYKAELYIEEIVKTIYQTVHDASVYCKCTNQPTLHDVWGYNNIFSFARINSDKSHEQAQDNNEQNSLNASDESKSNEQEKNDKTNTHSNNRSSNRHNSNILFCAVFTPRGLLVASESFMNSTLCHTDKVMLAALAIDRLTGFHSKHDLVTTLCKGVVTIDVLKLNVCSDNSGNNNNKNDSQRAGITNMLPIELVVWTIGDALCVLVAFKAHDPNERTAIMGSSPNSTRLVKHDERDNNTNISDVKSNDNRGMSSSLLTAETLMEFIICQCSQSTRCLMHPMKCSINTKHAMVNSYEECLEYMCSHSTYEQETSAWEDALRIFDMQQEKQQECSAKTQSTRKNKKKNEGTNSNVDNNAVSSGEANLNINNKEKSQNDAKEYNDLSNTQSIRQKMEYYEQWCKAAAYASVLEYYAVSHYRQHDIESLLWEFTLKHSISNNNVVTNNKKSNLAKGKSSSANNTSTGSNGRRNEIEYSGSCEEKCFTVGLFTLYPSLSTVPNTTSESNNELLNKTLMYIFNPLSVIGMTRNMFEHSEATKESILFSTNILPLPIIYNKVECQCVAGDNDNEVRSKLSEQCSSSQYNTEVSVLNRHYMLNKKSKRQQNKNTNKESKNREENNVDSVDADKSKTVAIEESTPSNSIPAISTSSPTNNNNNIDSNIADAKSPETTLGTSASTASNTNATPNVSLPPRSKSANTRASRTSFFTKLSKRLSRSLSRSRSKRSDARVSSTSTPPLPLYPTSLSAPVNATSVSANTNQVNANRRSSSSVSNENNNYNSNTFNANQHSDQRTVYINEIININKNVLNVEATLMRALRKRNVSFLTENDSKELRSLCKEIIFSQEAT